MSQIFAITGSGLRPIGREPIKIHAGGMYHYGGSSSPDPVWVESTDDQRTVFYRYPYGDKCRQREQTQIFRSLAYSGTRTKLKSLQHFAETCTKGEYGYPVPEWCQTLLRHYVAVLNGHDGLTWDRDDIRMVKIEVAYRGDGDAWSIFERSYPHAVSGSYAREDGSTVLDSYDFNKSAASELCHRINCGQLPGFEYLGSTERDN